MIVNTKFVHNKYKTSLNGSALRIKDYVATKGDKYYREISRETGIPLHVVRYQCAKLASMNIVELIERGPLVLVHLKTPEVPGECQ